MGLTVVMDHDLSDVWGTERCEGRSLVVCRYFILTCFILFYFILCLFESFLLGRYFGHIIFPC
jgi:hypothetical protein